MKKRKLLLATIAAVFAFSPVTLLSHQSMNTALAIQQQVGRQFVSLGASLDANNAQQTLQLLGANQVPASNIIYVDGNMINRYLQDGSNASTQVFSSAYIQEMPEGYGVQVQIVTPQNITLVTPLTYQNAAITAGAKNVNIRIATVTPVTGEGALTGVYALLEQAGVAVNTKDVQVAQKEITLVNEIQQDATVSNNVANDAIADIKTQVVNAIQEQEMSGNEFNNEGDVTLSQEQITVIVNNITETYNITNEIVIEQLIVYAEEFAQTEAAKNVETIEQLEISMTGNWIDILPEIPNTLTPKEIFEMERLDFSDTTIYHPIIQQMVDNAYYAIENGGIIDDIYNDTFILEMVLPSLTQEDKAALNELRTLMYQYEGGRLDPMIQNGETYLSPDMTFKDAWLQDLRDAEQIGIQEPVLAEIIRQIGITALRSPQVYSFYVVDQKGPVITFESYQEMLTGQISDYVQFTYNVETGEINQLDEVTLEPIPLVPFTLGEKYGVDFMYEYTPLVPVPTDYRIPGYVEETTEEDTTEETFEEWTEELTEEWTEELTEEWSEELSEEDTFE